MKDSHHLRMPVLLLAAALLLLSCEREIPPHIPKHKTDMRSLATGLESYYVDNGRYPPCTTDTLQSALHFGPGERIIPSFRIMNPKYRGKTLTTPVAYVTGYFSDPFALTKNNTYGYYTVKIGDYEGWILFTPGPDRDYDFVTIFYDPSILQPSPTLLTTCTYDPTNGLESDGDLWRVKQ